MADRNPEVMEMVSKELEKDPSAKADTLFERARKIDASIGDLNLRQFHARYALPVKRRMSSGTGKRRGGRRAATRGRRGAKAAFAAREDVRKVFLDFAGALAKAETPGSIVDVLSKVDTYVDRVIERSR